MDEQNKSQNIAPPQSTIFPESKPRLSLLKMVFVCLIMIGIGLAVGYYLFAYTAMFVSFSDRKEEISTSPTRLSTHPTSPTQKETIDWSSIISNNKWTVINTPSTWSILAQTIISSPNESLSGVVKSADIQENKNDLCMNCLKIHSQKEMTINGQKIIIQEVTSHPGGRLMRAYIMKDTNHVIRVNGYPGTGFSDPDKQFNNNIYNEYELILSTLKL